jgi:aminopeptidase N
VATVADPVTRGSIWLALRDAFEDAELEPAVATDLVCAALAAEDEDNGLRALAAFATVDLVGRALGGDVGARRRVAAAARARMASAAAGSGIQLAAARAYVGAADDPDELAGWLEGRAPEGLVMDAEMRWRTLAQCTRLGTAGPDRIDEEFARDHSNEGETYAARCRASLPEPAAKAAAWELLTRDAAVSNHVLYATCQGFWWPEQQALTDPYVERYFAEMPATGAFRHGWVVAESVGESYPRYAVRPQTVAVADTLIADPALDGSVRRRLVDGTDDLRRALAVRDRWLG